MSEDNLDDLEVIHSDNEPAEHIDEDSHPEGESVKIRRRQFSPKTLELMKSAAETLKKEGEEEFGNDDVPVVDTEPAEPEVGQAAGQAQPDEAVGSQAAPGARPDPLVEQTRQRWEAKLGELDAREKAISEREHSTDLDAIRDEYLERPYLGARKMLELLHGKLTDEEFELEAASLVTDISENVLGVQLDPAVKQREENRRTRKALTAFQKAQQVKEAKHTKEREAQEAKAQMDHGILEIKKAILAPDVSKQFPFLANEDECGFYVWDTIQKQYEKDGTILDWKDASKRVDNFLKQKASEWYAKRKHLLNAPTGKPEDVSSSKAQSHQQDPQGISRSKTLTNAKASTSTTEVKPKGKWSNEEQRKDSMRKLRMAFQGKNSE